MLGLPRTLARRKSHFSQESREVGVRVGSKWGQGLGVWGAVVCAADEVEGLKMFIRFMSALM